MRPKNISGAWCQFREATVQFGSTSDRLDKYRRNAHVTTTQAVPGWLAIPNPGGKLMPKFHGPFMSNIIPSALKPLQGAIRVAVYAWQVCGFITVEQALKVSRGRELSQCGGVFIGCRLLLGLEHNWSRWMWLDLE
jgi:hypothetical protein